MKSILLIIASLFSYNENIDQFATNTEMFTLQQATFVPQAKTYYYSFKHEPAQMNSTMFSNFKNGSSSLYYYFHDNYNIDNSTAMENEFFVSVNGAKFYFEKELGYLSGNTIFSIPNFFTFDYTATTTIGIQIPSLDSQAISQHADLILNNTFLMTRDATKNYLLGGDYTTGFDNGYTNGYIDGEYDGYTDGYTDGYDIGVIDGQEINPELAGIFKILGQGFTSIASILSIELFSGFTLGLLLFLPVIFGIAYALLKFLLGGSS